MPRSCRAVPTRDSLSGASPSSLAQSPSDQTDMYTRRNIRWRIILRFAWRTVLFFTVWSVMVTSAYLQLKSYGIDVSLPLAPLSTIGVAVAFYVGFKNNQSYDRYWEGRKIWGGIVNVSRSFANQILHFVSEANLGSSRSQAPAQSPPTVPVAEHHRVLIYRQLAWINALRFQLRRKTPFGFEPKGAARKFMQPTDIGAMRELLGTLLDEQELQVICSQFNSATQLLRYHGAHLKKLADDEKLIDEFRYIALMNSIHEMYALQGKCERIKNTPFPRQYAYFSAVFTWIFMILLPFGLVNELADRGTPMIWLTVPLSVVIAWIFFTMETVGDASEDPFENFINDVPMTALCRTIEIDLRQMLGEKEVPPPMKAERDILM